MPLANTSPSTNELLGENAETSARGLPDAAARYLCGYEGLTGVRMYRGEG